MTPGRFITFEGGEGSGKSTQIRRLAARLAGDGLTVRLTREPGGSPMGERIRSILLDPDARLDAITQLFLFSAARRDHVVALIEPSLRLGEWVLCDRFADSSRAYQGAAGDVPAALVKTLEQAAVGSTAPDMTIILDIAPERGLARAHLRRGAGNLADAFEAADVDFHHRVRAAYLEIARLEPARCVVIDADRPEDAVANDIAAHCRARLGASLQSVSDG